MPSKSLHAQLIRDTERPPNTLASTVNVARAHVAMALVPHSVITAYTPDARTAAASKLAEYALHCWGALIFVRDLGTAGEDTAEQFVDGLELLETLIAMLLGPAAADPE